MGFASHRFGEMHTGGRWSPGVELPQGLVCGPAGCVQVIDHADDVVLHALEPSDRLTKLNTCAAVRHRHLERRLAGTYLVGTQNGDSLQGRRFYDLPAVP